MSASVVSISFQFISQDASVNISNVHDSVLSLQRGIERNTPNVELKMLSILNCNGVYSLISWLKFVAVFYRHTGSLLR